MAIYRLFSSTFFGPDEIEPMTVAYESAVVELCLTNRNDTLTEDNAKAIVNVAGTGERDPVGIKCRALNALGLSKPDDAGASAFG